ncbi:MAG: ATPase associated with various cellular activity 3, partial [Dehalococcoidia bacterium]|nr:ATPase associated with various cellular activity 3 [Dehalococcoidia bacterium]
MGSSKFLESAERLCNNIKKIVVVREKTVDLLVAGFLSGGHVLLEDVPGVGKTLLAKALAGSINGSLRRIQFTPDLLPSDITGGAIYNQNRGEFIFSPGPIFANIVLADEVNRATPRTQAALLEAMGEGQVSIDNTTHPLPAPFFVIATQNPVEVYGTFPLPESQLDRFLLLLHMGYPEREDEIVILDRSEHSEPQVTPVLSLEDVAVMRGEVQRVEVAASVKGYIVDLVTATRENPEVALGVSPRGAVSLQRAAQGVAAMAGRSYVIPDDVKSLAVSVLAHRLVMRSSHGPTA